MLVVISDVHLTDGTSGTIISPEAFNKFCRILDEIIWKPEETKIRKVEIVLLGDIFDVIRSSTWLRPENSGDAPIRPWSGAIDTDSEGWDLEAYTGRIVDDILTWQNNITAMDFLRTFRTNWAGKGVDVTFSYFMGNHDWLINRYPETRRKVAAFLGMADPAAYATERFPESRVFQEYGVMVRHGDYYDNFNYEGNRDASSLGDAIVIDLLSKFPKAVENDPILRDNQALVDRLRELDNVRPLLELPAWIQGLCNEYPEVEERLHAIWNGLADSFFHIPFVKAHDRFGPDFVDFLQAALRLTSSFSFSRLMEIVGNAAIRYFYSKADDYKRYACNEAALKSNNARYVVYGHTHRAEQVPLDTVPLPKGAVFEKIYFNSGTWRKVFERTAFDQDKCEFIGWHVMTFLVFYLESEKQTGRTYEVWSGSLGYRR
jgi:UDP-2,3-diacylglucosamine pyrophosphatase LpxH